MDVCSSLEAELYRCSADLVPVRWRADPTLEGFDSLGEVVSAIRTLGATSDRVVRALLGQRSPDPLVVMVIVVGLMPVAMARCHDRDQVDELIAELAIELGHAHADGIPVVKGLLASRLFDRAWDRVRAPLRRPAPVVPFDALDLSWQRIGAEEGPEDVALDRVTVAEVRAFVATCPEHRDSLVRAWNSAVELAGLEVRTAVERDRWKYVRSQLRRRCPSELVA